AALHVDGQADGLSFPAVIDLKAKLLDPIRAPKATTALQQALDQLRMAAAGRSYRGAPGPPAPEQALRTLQMATGPQELAEAACRRALAAAQQILKGAEQRVAEAAGQPADAVSAAEASRTSAAAQVDHGQAAVAGAHRELDALHGAIGALQHTDGGDANAAQARVTVVREHLQLIVD